MPGIVTGKHILWDVSLMIDDVDLSDHVESIEITVGINKQAAAAMSELQDYSMAGTITITDPKVTFYQDYATAKVYATMFAAWQARTVFEVRAKPSSGAAAIDNPEWTIPCFVGEMPVMTGTRGDRHMTAVTLTVAGLFTVLMTATPATGATAGTPGTWTPGGSTPPANLAGTSGVTATPSSAWTTGQYVVLGDSSHCYWNGTAWTAGEAP
jgi:hypothetical protein